MLKPAIPPIVDSSHIEKSNDFPSLPAFHNLPQWTRVNTLARSFPPKALLKDRLTRLPNSSFNNQLKNSSEVLEYENLQSEIRAKTSTDSMAKTDPLVRQLESCIAFLNKQHEELLSSLHNEIDKLKQEIRDLQFKLIMSEDSSNVFSRVNHLEQKAMPVLERVSSVVHDSHKESSLGTSSPRPLSSRRPVTRSKADIERQVRSLEIENLELRDSLREEKQKNALLEEQLDRMKSLRGKFDVATINPASSDNTSHQSTLFTPRPPVQPRPQLGAERFRRSLDASTAAAMIADVHVLTNQARSPSTMEECHELIRQLRIDFNRQALELGQLKADLKTTIVSQKLMPSALVLAKSSNAIESDHLLHQQHKTFHRSQVKKLSEAMYNSQDLLSLPSVKLSLGRKNSYRHHKRYQQSLHQSSLESELLSGHGVTDSH